MSVLSSYLSYLPPRAAEILLKYDPDSLSEIRLRTGRPMTVTTDRGNLPTGVTLSRTEMTETVSRLCGGSLHAFGDAIRAGYIPLPDGGRAGVCGTFSDGFVTEITSVCLRIPRAIRGAGADLCRLLTGAPGTGLLIYSPPGVGKTTLLRDLAAALASPPYRRRVALIDSRRELYWETLFRNTTVDLYLGYPKAAAMEQAVRTMAPQYLVCDELGNEEAESILGAQNAGVPLIASAHAPSLEALLRRPALLALDKAGVFGYYAGLERDGSVLRLTVTERKEAAP